MAVTGGGPKEGWARPPVIADVGSSGRRPTAVTGLEGRGPSPPTGASHGRMATVTRQGVGADAWKYAVPPSVTLMWLRIMVGALEPCVHTP